MPATNSDRFALSVNEKEPDLKAGILNLKRKAEYGSRNEDTIKVNPVSQAAMRLFENNVNLSASQNTISKMNDKQNIQQSFEEKHTTNRFSVDTYDIMVNGHKLNPNLWEYSDFKQFNDMYGGIHCVGAFSVFGTVLIPSWDAQLHKYVLVRRLARMPMFSPKNNVPEILKTLNIEDPTEVIYKYDKKQETQSAEEWYQQVGKQYDNKKYNSGPTQANPDKLSGATQATSEMVEKAVQWCINTANETGHYYAPEGSPRQGPDYDCTSFVSAGLIKAGLGIDYLGGADFNDDLIAVGYEQIPYPGLSGLQRGDILDNGSHVELYIGNGQIVGAHNSGREPEDQISVDTFWESNWQYVLRYKGSAN